MRSDIKSCIIFAAGVVVGATATFFAVKETYKAKANEEIASVKETFARINQEAIEKAAMAKNKPDLSVYTQVLENSRAAQITEEEPVEESEEGPEDEDPDPIVVRAEHRKKDPIRIISTNEFVSELNGYTKITFFRFKDDIYTDETYEQINPISYLGRDMVNYIRTCKEDELCIRNDSIMVDVNVALLDRSYKEYMST